MAAKPTYEELKNRIQELEKQIADYAEKERTLMDNQERFRQLYERAPLAYQSLNEQGRLIEVNQAWLDMLGYSRDEVIGRSMGEFLSKEWRKHFKQNFPRFKAVGEVLGIEFELRTKEGFPILVSINGRIGYDKEGDFQQTHCILYDITERDQADRLRDQIIADLHEELAKEKEMVDSIRNQVIDALQHKMATAQEIAEVLAACDSCSKKLKK
jgi:two-component system cell cycle sensor histidine kinase/response regulator CckA